jgi:hypothetical protein
MDNKYKHRRQSLCCNHQVLLIAALLLSATVGCLSLGGRTTHVQEKPETEGRLRALETRVDAIDGVITTHQPIVPGPAGNGVMTDAYEPTPSPPDGSY